MCESAAVAEGDELGESVGLLRPAEERGVAYLMCKTAGGALDTARAGEDRHGEWCGVPVVG